ncbi:MAG: tRNA (N6-isopentenyl adenosine(37)-C2)-methylthiotransferase MiaB [Planctomycetes bacterium]|nr:tRNA (N6-isopentenyl adenosine(37)-C2)-methylthiotransferase MiaB [Planctomycetota bacterium]
MTLTRTTSKGSPESAPRAPKLHVVTFGCQMNKYDSLLAEGRFKRQGYATTEDMGDADVVLFNTCSVREHAEERTFSWLGELKRAKEKNPGLVIGVMGCMAQRIGEEIFARAGHVDLVAGTRQFANLPQLVDRVREAREKRGGADKGTRVLALEMNDAVAVDRDDEPWDGGLHAYLTVMRGCDLNCTYCIVPAVRGRVLSYGIDKLVHEAEWFVSRGAKVITLLGQTVNSYGEDCAPPLPGEARGRGRQGRPSLADLIYRLQDVRGLERIRLITLHPSYVTEALAEALRDCSKAERYLPIPAQSGSDAILRAMKRGYTTDLYKKRMEILRSRVPDLELASDWIAGFCGETDADHAASEALMAEQGFVTNYIFKYDPRPTTHAAEHLTDDVPEDVKKERNQRLLALAERVGLERHGRHVGSVRDVFVESVSDRTEGGLVGRTQHGLMTSFRGAPELVGTVARVQIEGATAFGLSASLATSAPTC